MPLSRIEEALDIVKRAKALGDYDVNVIGMAGEIIAEDLFGMSKTAVGTKTIDGYWRSQEDPRSVQVKGWSDARVRRYRGGTFFRVPEESGPDDLLVILFLAGKAEYVILFNGPTNSVGVLEKNGKTKVVRLDHLVEAGHLKKLLESVDELAGT